MISEVVRDIRINWKISDDKRDEGLTTPEDIIRFDDISYGPYGDANLLDIYHQKKVTKPQKTIISIHGGGWVYGSKEQYQFYGMRLAQRGFTFVNFNYRLAPEYKYPTALEDINQVFLFDILSKLLLINYSSSTEVQCGHLVALILVSLWQ